MSCFTKSQWMYCAEPFQANALTLCLVLVYLLSSKGARTMFLSGCLLLYKKHFPVLGLKSFISCWGPVSRLWEEASRYGSHRSKGIKSEPPQTPHSPTRRSRDTSCHQCTRRQPRPFGESPLGIGGPGPGGNKSAPKDQWTGQPVDYLQLPTKVEKPSHKSRVIPVPARAALECHSSPDTEVTPEQIPTEPPSII